MALSFWIELVGVSYRWFKLAQPLDFL